MKEENEKAGFKLNIQKTKIMASGPTTSWKIDMKTVTDFVLLYSKITVDSGYSHELKDTCSLEKSYDEPRQHTKSRGITLPTKVHLVKAMVFPVVVYGCESRTINKAEHQRIDAFEL